MGCRMLGVFGSDCVATLRGTFCYHVFMLLYMLVCVFVFYSVQPSVARSYVFMLLYMLVCVFLFYLV